MGSVDTTASSMPANPSVEKSQRGAGSRVLIYSHDTFGLGHLHRCLKIARSLMEHMPELSVLLVTGSPVVHRFELPPGTDYIKLPAVRKVGPEDYEARSLGTSYRRILTLRTNMLRQTVEDFKPHLFLVDHSPTGMKGEILPALKWLKETGSDCTTVLGLRDIIDANETVIDLWKREWIYDVLDKLYDQVLIYGNQSIFDTTEAYKFPTSIRNKSLYVGYVHDQRDSAEYELNAVVKKHEKLQVLVTIGGGDGAGEIIIGSYLKMLKKYASKIDFESTIVTGPFLSDKYYESLVMMGKGLPLKIEKFLPSLRQLLTESDLVVSTCGYNTMTQILGYARRSLMIPRVLHRKEQLIRATTFEDMGLVGFLHPDEVDADSLYKRIRELLSSDSEPLVESRKAKRVALDGADRVSAIINELLPDRGEETSQEESI